MLSNNLPDGGVRFLEPEEDDFDGEGYEEWREEQFAESWDDICSNLQIEVEDVSILIDDEVLRELIIAEHDKRWPDTFTIEEYAEEIEEKNEGDY